MPPVATCVYSSSACNKSPRVLDWGRNGLICYGACHAVNIFAFEECSSGGKVIQSLIGHKDLVTSVHWIKHIKGASETELISTSADKTAIIWTKKESTFLPAHHLVGHNFVIATASATYCQDYENNLLVATASADSTVKIWKRHSDLISCSQTISFGNRLALDVCFSSLEFYNVAILAIGGDDGNIYLYVPNAVQQFEPAVTLIGHDDWIRSLDFIFDDNDDLLLTSSSQDCFIRIWKISLKVRLNEIKSDDVLKGKEILFKTVSDIALNGFKDRPLGEQRVIVWNLEINADFGRCKQILSKTKIKSLCLLLFIEKAKYTRNFLPNMEDIFVLDGVGVMIVCNEFSISLESVLGGHEDWVYSVRWGPFQFKDGCPLSKPLQILSSSMDKTMVIWEPDPVSKIWFEKVRVGEVGGNTLGFYGGVFSPNGKSILAHGYHGAIHLWHFDEKLNAWQPDLAFGGHFSSVQSVGWDPEGEFIISCSHDQTTRLHAPYVSESKTNNWHEIARPQVHGYDMVCLSVINRYKFISGGDEKVLRVFNAPRSFAENIQNICSINSSSYIKDLLPDGASVPSLGLSNKAVYEEDIKKVAANANEQKHAKDQYPEFYYTPVTLSAPPAEELLIQNTLWPEVQKLYGHPYEVYTLAVNHSGTIVASSCKASKAEHAAIILWDIATWKQLGHLIFHNLTVTQISFSPNDEYLLSVSRDRMWVLYKNFPNETPPYKKVLHMDKKSAVHSRIIWSCAWSHDSMHFATASRDKKVAIWSQEFISCSSMETEDSATSVSFAPCLIPNNRYLIAIGMENGKIIICTWQSSQGNGSWMTSLIMDKFTAHHLNVNMLKFSPVLGEAGCQKKESNILQLASCGSDYHTKVYNLWIDTFS